METENNIIISTVHGEIRTNHIFFRGQRYDFSQIESWGMSGYSDKNGMFSLRAIIGYVIILIIANIFSPLISTLILLALLAIFVNLFFIHRYWMVMVKFYNGKQMLVEISGKKNEKRPYVDKVARMLREHLPAEKGAILGL